jgi:hypothetical protein
MFRNSCCELSYNENEVLGEIRPQMIIASFKKPMAAPYSKLKTYALYDSIRSDRVGKVSYRSQKLLGSFVGQ